MNLHRTGYYLGHADQRLLHARASCTPLFARRQQEACPWFEPCRVQSVDDQAFDQLQCVGLSIKCFLCDPEALAIRALAIRACKHLPKGSRQGYEVMNTLSRADTVDQRAYITRNFYFHGFR